MTSIEFSNHCLRTWNAGLTPSKAYLNATEGFMGESGEVAELFKHQEFHPNKALPVTEFHDRLIEEAGDVLYYAAVINKDSLSEFDGFIATVEYSWASNSTLDILESSWYNGAVLISMVMRETECTIEQIMVKNVEKLKKRWPNGFDNKPQNTTKC